MVNKTDVTLPAVEEALIEVYKKYYMGLDNISWGKLGELLVDALCELKGDDWFHYFLEQKECKESKDEK